MKSFSFVKALLLVSMVAAVPLACGDSEENPRPSPGDGGEPGAGGTEGRGGEPGIDPGEGGAPAMLPGTSTMSETLECDDEPACESVATISPTLFINPCCTGDGACGVSTEFLSAVGGTFEAVCQPKGQEGELDTACPDSADQMVPLGMQTFPVPGFKGCCRATTNTCGVIVNEIASGPIEFADFGLGCVDSAPFFEGEPGAACGEGVGGAGGAGGAGGGGVPGTEGGAGVGGAAGGAGGGE